MYYTSDLIANGVTVNPPIPVTHDGETTQVYRLKANGVDLFHKFLEIGLNITIKLSFDISFEPGSVTCTSVTYDDFYFGNIKAKITWTSTGEKTIRQIKIPYSYQWKKDSTGSLYGGSGSNNAIVTQSGDEFNITTNDYDNDSDTGRIYQKFDINTAVVTFTDGTSAEFSLNMPWQQTNVNTKPEPRNYSASYNFSRTLEIQEY